MYGLKDLMSRYFLLDESLNVDLIIWFGRWHLARLYVVVLPSHLKEVIGDFFRYSVDGARYMLLREGVPHMDGNFVESRMVHYLNLELADTLGKQTRN